MKTAFVAVLLGLALASSAVWAQDAPAPASGGPATTAAPEGGTMGSPEMMEQMMAQDTAPPKKPFPVVPLAVAIAVIAIIAAVVMKNKGEGGGK